MTVKNRWNNNLYKVISLTDKEVTLERTVDYFGHEKGSQLTITKSEYFFSYVEKK